MFTHRTGTNLGVRGAGGPMASAWALASEAMEAFISTTAFLVNVRGVLGAGMLRDKNAVLSAKEEQ